MVGADPPFLASGNTVFRACLKFVFASENCQNRVLRKSFLNSIAGLWCEKKAKSGSGNDNLQRKG
jgi:hypothetical protein